MFDEKYFETKSLNYLNSEDITVNVEFFMEGTTEPTVKKAIGKKDFEISKEANRHVHVDLPGSFEIAISAVVDDIVYFIVYEQMAEYGWKKIHTSTLTKKKPREFIKLEFQGKPYGNLALSVAEWGGIKRGIML